MTDSTSLAAAATQIRTGELTPLELLEPCIDRIRRYDDRVHAWVMVDEERARRAAEELGREAARGEFRGPLHGIPLGIKDIIDVAGLPTRAGSPLREDHVARVDAPLVAALVQAGAIVLGKTVTVEFACFDPSPSRNPWDPQLKHSPGGSSSGSAVAVAMGMCPGAIGTQTGGSLVRPSSYCGIATCKPTFGRVDATGVVPVSFTLDHPGPMARCVADLEIILRCLPKSRDFGPRYVGQPEPNPLRPVPAEPAGSGNPVHPGKPPRLGFVEEFFMDRAETPVRQAVTAAIDTLRRQGAEIRTVTIADDFAQINQLHTLIMAAEAAAYHRQSFAAHRGSYGPKITSLLDEGLAAKAVDYAAALARLGEFRRRVRPMLGDLDALVMPATDTTAPPTLETTGNKDFQAPWSCSGLPVISLPCGLASDRMPVAVQLVGRDYQEAALFRVAQWCEKCFNFRHLPPLLTA